MKHLATGYDVDRDCVYVVHPERGKILSQHDLKLICSAVVKINTERWRSLPPGEIKDKFAKMIEAAKSNRIYQVQTDKGDIELFKSTKGTGKIITY